MEWSGVERRGDERRKEDLKQERSGEKGRIDKYEGGEKRGVGENRGEKRRMKER